MCVGRELDRDTRVDEAQALEEIRRLFARYRQGARHGMVAEREQTLPPPADEPGFPLAVTSATAGPAEPVTISHAENLAALGATAAPQMQGRPAG